MRAIVTISVAIFLTSPTIARSAEISVGPVTVTLPTAFQGPVRSEPDPKTEIVAYSSPRQDHSAADVVEVTRYAVGSAPPGANEETYAQGAEQYLKQMLQGVERRRTDYSQSTVARVRITGHIGARATWTGALQGVPTNGVMYCVIIGANAWFVHIFGQGDHLDSQLESVAASLEHAH
jgi:hypothetical protein